MAASEIERRSPGEFKFRKARDTARDPAGRLSYKIRKNTLQRSGAIAGHRPASDASATSKAYSDLLALNYNRDLAGTLAVSEHLLHALRVLGHIDICEGDLLALKMPPGIVGVGSSVLSKYQNLLGHCAPPNDRLTERSVTITLEITGIGPLGQGWTGLSRFTFQCSTPMRLDRPFSICVSVLGSRCGLTGPSRFTPLGSLRVRLDRLWMCF